MGLDRLTIDLLVEQNTFTPAMREAKEALGGFRTATVAGAAGATTMEASMVSAGSAAQRSAVHVQSLGTTWKESVRTLKDGIEIAEKIWRNAEALFRGTVGQAIAMRGENDALANSWRAAGDAARGVGVSIGEVILQSVPIDTVTAAFDDVAASILDADSALGGFVRGALAGLTDVAGRASELALRIYQVAASLSDAAEVAQNNLIGESIQQDLDIATEAYTNWSRSAGEAAGEVVQWSALVASGVSGGTDELDTSARHLTVLANEVYSYFLQVDALQSSLSAVTTNELTAIESLIAGWQEVENTIDRVRGVTDAVAAGLRAAGDAEPPEDSGGRPPRGGGGGRQDDGVATARRTAQLVTREVERQADAVEDAYKRQKDALEEWNEAQYEAAIVAKELADEQAALFSEQSKTKIEGEQASLAASEASRQAEIQGTISGAAAVAQGLAGLFGGKREMEVVNGLIEEAQAISSLAIFDGWGFATHQLAAAAHFKAAAAAGSSGGGGGGGSSRGGGGGGAPAGRAIATAAAPRPEAAKQDESRQGGIVINNYGPIDHEAAGRAWVRATNRTASLNSGLRLDPRILGRR